MFTAKEDRRKLFKPPLQHLLLSRLPFICSTSVKADVAHSSHLRVLENKTTQCDERMWKNNENYSENKVAVLSYDYFNTHSENIVIDKHIV